MPGTTAKRTPNDRRAAPSSHLEPCVGPRFLPPAPTSSVHVRVDRPVRNRLIAFPPHWLPQWLPQVPTPSVSRSATFHKRINPVGRSGFAALFHTAARRPAALPGRQRGV